MAQGVEHVFCVPGESYLAVLDALHDAPIALTVCRQEGGAAMMADAVGPAHRPAGHRHGDARARRHQRGARHPHRRARFGAADPVHRPDRARHAGPRAPSRRWITRAFFGSTAKWVVEIDDAARIPEIVSRAFHVAMQGRPGPVVIALPEDMLVETAAVADAPRVEPVLAWPGLTQMAELQKLLWAAERPDAGAGRRAAGPPRRAPAVTRFAERFDLPVATSFRRAGLFDADHPNYAGEIGIGPNPKLKARLEAADLLLLVGGRMAEMPSQSYTLLDIPVPRQTLVHVHAGRGGARPRLPPGARHPGRARRPSRPRSKACSRRATLALGRGDARRRAPTTWPGPSGAPPAPGAVDMARGHDRAARAPARTTPIVTNGAGNYAIWVGPLLPLPRLRHAARADLGLDGLRRAGRGRRPSASIPDRMVVAFAGDGCFLMNGQEFATAVQYGLADHRDRGRQRHVRHDPHAPGARLSRPRLRHRR